MAYRIYNNESGDLLGEITEIELSSLTSLLEEESAEDRDYYIMADTVDYLETNGADAVSYTHLDVYKRQFPGRGASR